VVELRTVAPAVAGSIPVTHPKLAAFLRALEERHLADLRFSEVTRALRALSSAYVERRETALAEHKALDGAGKRAAFALYYGPIHFLLVQHIVRELGAAPNRGTVVDLGCGTGVAGAAVATAGAEAAAPHLLGIDTHPWTLEEARFTYQSFGLRSDVRRGHAGRARFPADMSFVVAAFVVNELKDGDRSALLQEIIRLKAGTTRPHRAGVLIIEPISQRISPWWGEWAEAFQQRGGRADEWRVRIDAPPIVKRLSKAAGLRPEVLTARSLFVT
jgi:predicted RNA methylase